MYKAARSVNPRSELFGALATDDMRKQPSLQAADLFAWHYRYGNELRLGVRKPPVHRATLALIKHAKFFEVPKDKFVAQVEGLFQQHGTEWSNQVWQQLVERETRRQERQERGKKWRGDS
jgi:hypothetical protein